MKSQILIPLLAGLVLLGACKGKSKYEIVNNSSSADTVSTKTDTATGTKLVKTADIRFKVKSIQQTGDRIAALTTGYHGIVMHHQVSSTPERSLDVPVSNDSVMRITAFNSTADVTVKIPSDKLEDFMNEVARMGIYVNSRTMDISDKSLDYLSAKLKLQNRNELVSQ